MPRNQPVPETLVSHETLPGQFMTAVIHGNAGRSAVLLHGLPGDRDSWVSVAPRLRAHRRLVVPDLLGFGASDALRPEQHAEDEARAVLALLDALGIEQVDVVGHDFGGPTALWMWRLAPDRIVSLALLATNAFRDTPIPGFLKLARVPVLGDALFHVLFSRPGLLMMWLQATGDRSAYPLREYRRILRSAVGVRSTRDVFLRSLRRLDRLYREVEQSVGTVTVPRLVIWGDRDPFFALREGERLARQMNAPLETLAGCGHFIPQERPAEVAALLQRLWEGGDPRPGS